MKFFAIEIHYDRNQNSPWDALWNKGKYDELDCLYGSLTLAPIWKPPSVRLEKREKTPGMYSFISNFAVTDSVRRWLQPLVKREAEFLPLDVPDSDPLYVIHPLWPLDFDEHAVVHPHHLRSNITRVEKYSFQIDPDLFPGPRHLFRMRQAEGSPARAQGYTLHTLIVSEKFKTLCEKHKLKGVRFKLVHEID